MRRRMTSSLPQASRRTLFVQLSKFFAGTLVGLAVDFGVYLLATAVGIEPGIANAISSTCAVIVTYIISVRFTFGVKPGLRSFAEYAAWYAISIAVFSVAIQFIHDAPHLDAIWAKLFVLPFSFIANFIASRVILIPRSSQRQGLAVDPAMSPKAGSAHD